MPGNSRQIIGEAERRFPVRIYVLVPPAGFGRRLTRMEDWLDENCGADGWMKTPAGRSVVNDTAAFYFRDATLSAAFVARWCVGGEDGLYQGREDEPTRRVPTKPHKSPP